MDVEGAHLDADVRDRILSWALVGAGLLGLAAAFLPDMPGADRTGLAASGAALLAIAGLVRMTLGRFRFGIHLMAGLGCLVVAAGLIMAGGGVASAVFGLLLFWPVVAAALLLPSRQAGGLAAFALASYGGALVVGGVPTPWWAWLALSATLLAGTLVASALGARLRALASTDSRTGAVSPRFWEEMVSRECARSGRSGHPLCVAVVSVDGLDDYHEAGHMAGERYLRETTQAWTGALRGGDLLTHLQGEEFGVLLPECGDAAARTVVDRLRGSTPDERTSSAGIAMWNGTESHTALVNRACAALHHARGAGRDQSFVSAA
jgi:diguanylate cyclase (GGDEF)-like protein